VYVLRRVATAALQNARELREGQALARASIGRSNAMQSSSLLPEKASLSHMARGESVHGLVLRGSPPRVMKSINTASMRSLPIPCNSVCSPSKDA